MISSKPYLFRAIYQWLLDSELTPYVMVDAQVPNVEVPEDYIEDGQIILDMTPSAIIDLEMGNEHVEFKARFSGVTRHIILPMSAILALYAYENGRGMVFTDEEEDDNLPPDGDDDDGQPTGGKPHLRVVK